MTNEINSKEPVESADVRCSSVAPCCIGVRKEVIGDCTLYLGDCTVVLPQLPNFDLILTDPPYGIGADKKASKQSGVVCGHGHRRVAKKAYEKTEWDNETPPFWFFLLMSAKARNNIIWGGNYFGLPESPCWLVWDKENGDNNFADCELAWTNLEKAVRLKKHLWNGFARANSEKRYNHPTQKPVPVMEWCLTHVPNAKTVCDPFMGSGTTGVACARKGLSFAGIEREQKYFDIACERIAEAYRTKPRLFETVEKKQAEQLSLI